MEISNQTVGAIGKIGQVVDLKIEQVELPDDLKNIVEIELLQWIVSRSLSEAIVASCARYRIQIIKKPRSKIERYVVVGGIVPFLILLRASTSVYVRVVLVEETSVNIPQLLNDDLFLWLFALKAGAMAGAGKAALLTNLVDHREESMLPSGFGLTGQHLAKGGGLLKGLTGYDSRAFKREKIDPVPPALEIICKALDVNHDALNQEYESEDKDAF